MNFKKTFKKIFATILIFTMIFGIMNISGNNTTAKASSNPVKMYYKDHYSVKYGYLQYSVYIQIDANSAANKEVYVHHSLRKGFDDIWVDTEAKFLTKLDSNTEIWVADIAGYETGDFVIKYIGDGVTYWDNNNGNNYTKSDIVGSACVKAFRRDTNHTCTIKAVVKNLAYEKHVKVRYTLDNWNTYQDVPMSYVNSDYGVNGELWSVGLNLSLEQINSDGFHFCICYEVNGQTYWDNNFGQNYDMNYYGLF